MRYTLLLFVLTLSASSWSQTGSINIQCIDKSTKKPLIACIVIESDTIVASGCTDIQGKRKFSNIPNGAIRIHVTHNGDTLTPKAAFVQTNQLLQLSFQLSGNRLTVQNGNNFDKSADGEQDPQSIREAIGVKLPAPIPPSFSSQVLEVHAISCVAYRKPLMSITNTSIGYTFAANDINNMPLRSVNRIASTVQGVRIDEVTNTLNIRGARSDANTYFIDGCKVKDLSGIPKVQINSLSVYSGGIPAKYGDLTGGVIAVESAPIKCIPRTYVTFPFFRSGNTPVSTTSAYTDNYYHQNEPVSVNEFRMDKFTPIYENDFVSPITDPNSTFSIDVDRASWTYVQNQYKKGLEISRDAVKLEEMINAFSYEDVKVPEGELMNVKVERKKCEWNNESELVTIHLKAKELPENIKRKPHNFVFLIDISGSMLTYAKIELIRLGLVDFVKTLNDDDRVSIVTYAGDVGVLLEPTLCSKKDEITRTLESLTGGGGTNGAGGIQTAYDLAESNYDPELNNRIILCTDGDFNVGIRSIKELEEFIATKRGCGIYLTALGFGMGNYRNDVLETLADRGDGNHFYINDLEECNRVLVEEAGNLLNIARDVKLNVEFNPRFVSKYRLIGYENRLLKPRDFKDDTKDAGEIGYGHEVTAVYEITPGEANIEVSTFTNSTAMMENKEDLAIVKLRYKSFEEESSVERNYTLKSSKRAQNDQLLNTVVSFGLLLRDSAFKGEMTTEKLSKMAAQLSGNSKEVTRLKEMIARFVII